MEIREQFVAGHGRNVQDFIERVLGVLPGGETSEIFKGLRPPAADPQQNEGMMLRGYENHEAIALVTCAS